MSGQACARQARKYGTVFRVSLQNAFAYRANLPVNMAFYLLFLFVFFNLWRAIYQGGQVTGYSFTQMIWYLCITELISFGAGTGIFREMGEDVKSGAIAYQLGRPYSYLSYQLFNALGGMAFKFIAFSALALAVGFAMVGPIEGFQPATLLLSGLSILLGMLINFFFLMALGLSAFRLEENSGLYLVYQKLVFMLGTFIPVEFLPAWLQGVARVLPFSYVSWAPARLAVNFSFAAFWELVPVQLIYLGLAIALAKGMYRMGVRGIQANGG